MFRWPPGISTQPLLIYLRAPVSIVRRMNTVSRPEPLSSLWQILWSGGIRLERYSSHHPLFPKYSMRPVSRVLSVGILRVPPRSGANGYPLSLPASLILLTCCAGIPEHFLIVSRLIAGIFAGADLRATQARPFQCAILSRCHAEAFLKPTAKMRRIRESIAQCNLADIERGLHAIREIPFAIP